MKLSNIKPNPKNPRIIKDDKFKKLVQSIKSFPEMMDKRPLVCVTDVDKKIYPLGGNMRLKAIQELNYKEIPDSWVVLADSWTQEQRNEFTIKDNVGFGEWDWDSLANEWDSVQLGEWGLDVWIPSEEVNLDQFFQENNEDSKDNKFKIVLEYTEEDYNSILEAFKKYSGSKEDIVFKLLNQ